MIREGWQQVTVEDIAPEKGMLVSGPFGSNIGKRFFVESGVPVIRGNNLNVRGKQFVDEGFVFITDEKAYELRNCEAVAGDIVFTAAGTLGQVGLIPRDSQFPKYIISNKQLRLRCDKRIAYPRYLFYYFRNPNMVNFIIGQNKGSSVPLITLGILRSLPVILPPLPTQRKIAAILSAYDDLIENNTRRIQLLEEAAQAIYREWFVAFRFPGHEAVEMIESELGLIPEGWEANSLAKLFPNDKKTVMTGPFGSKLHAHDYRDEGVPLILVKHVKNGHIIEDSLPLVGEHKWEELKRYRLKIEDIVVTRVGYVGDSAFIHPRYENWFFSGQTLRVRISSTTRLLSRFLAQQYMEYSFRRRIENNAVGATRPSLNTKILQDIPILVPPIEIQARFVNQVEVIDELWLNLNEKNNILKETRDMLLPRLISGELDVSELDIELGALET